MDPLWVTLMIAELNSIATNLTYIYKYPKTAPYVLKMFQGLGNAVQHIREDLKERPDEEVAEELKFLFRRTAFDVIVKTLEKEDQE